MSLRTVALAGVAVLAVVVGLIVLVSSSLDGIVKSGIEKYGSEIMGTSVRVGSVEIKLQEAQGTIRGLRVGNPDGFPSDDAISFGEITLGIDIDSIGSADPIVLNVVKIVEPSVALSINAKGKNNISVLQANVNRFAGSGGGDSAPSESSSDAPPTLLSIRKLSIAGGKLAADLSAMGGPKLETGIAAVHLSNLGGRKGSTPGELGATIADAFTKSILVAASKSAIADSLNQILAEGLDSQILDDAKGSIKGAKDLVKEVDAKKGIDGAKDFAKGLLNR